MKFLRKIFDFFLALRLFFFNKIINRIPCAFIRLPLLRLYLTLGRGSNILCHVEFLSCSRKKNISIGPNSCINTRCVLDGRGGKIRIGSCVDIARETAIFTLDHDPHSDSHQSRGRDVTVEDYVWIAARSLILPGLTIGRGAVVAAGSVVTRDVPPMTIVAGAPAQKIGLRHSKLNYHCRYFPYLR